MNIPYLTQDELVDLLAGLGFQHVMTGSANEEDFDMLGFSNGAESIVVQSKDVYYYPLVCRLFDMYQLPIPEIFAKIWEQHKNMPGND